MTEGDLPLSMIPILLSIHHRMLSAPLNNSYLVNYSYLKEFICICLLSVSRHTLQVFTSSHYLSHRVVYTLPLLTVLSTHSLSSSCCLHTPSPHRVVYTLCLGSPTKVGDLINFRKCTMVATILKHIQKYQTCWRVSSTSLHTAPQLDASVILQRGNACVYSLLPQNSTMRFLISEMNVRNLVILAFFLFAFSRLPSEKISNLSIYIYIDIYLNLFTLL